ncbi:MAG: hypothetical protein NTX59_07370 [Elusimicrobia bacterium]|nr:hypothetical protein [Elusimicrobiota bacterium]
MTKRHKEPKSPHNPAQPSAAAANAGQSQYQQDQAVPPQTQNDSAPAPAPSMKKPLLVFWSAVILAVAVSWTLEHFMPLAHEYIIERCVMLVFGGFLAVFLFFLK